MAENIKVEKAVVVGYNMNISRIHPNEVTCKVLCGDVVAQEGENVDGKYFGIP